jgi:hypothetical protein
MKLGKELSVSIQTDVLKQYNGLERETFDENPDIASTVWKKTYHWSKDRIVWYKPLIGDIIGESLSQELYQNYCRLRANMK